MEYFNVFFLEVIIETGLLLLNFFLNTIPIFYFSFDKIQYAPKTYFFIYRHQNEVNFSGHMWAILLSSC